MANKTRYTDEQIATSLATLQANSGNAKRTAKSLGIPLTTLRQWAGRAQSSTAHPKQVDPALVDQQSEKLAGNWERIALGATDKAFERLDEASVKDLLIGAGIATEKVQLLRGRATSRSEGSQIVYVQPAALRDLAGDVIDGQFRVESGTPKALEAGSA